MKLLLIEDDAQTAEYVRRGLVELGHASDHAATGIDGLTAAIVGKYDAIIMDRNLPGLDGLSVLKSLRAKGDQTPVLLLSALGQVDDRIAGLQAGSDDYLAKPFSFGELVARLEAIVRRRSDTHATQGTRQTGSLTLDLLGRTAMRNGRRIELPRHAGQVVTRTMLIEAIWDYNFDPGTNVVDVHVSRLRAKIDGPEDVPMIRTVRGSGYRLDAV